MEPWCPTLKHPFQMLQEQIEIICWQFQFESCGSESVAGIGHLGMGLSALMLSNVCMEPWHPM